MRYIIDRVEVHTGKMPVSLTFSYGAVEAFPFLILRVGIEQIEGVGEVVVPLNDFFIHLAKSLLGCDARQLDALLPDTHNDHDRILCESVSMALYDLMAKRSGLPFWAMLG